MNFSYVSREMRIALILFSFLFPSWMAAAIPSLDDKVYDPLPVRYCGSMMPYEFESKYDLPIFPDSLEIFHAEYVARHGARFLSSRSKIEGLEKTLLEAKAKNYLSADGFEFLAFLKQIETVTDNRWGNLSPLGIKEETRLGNIMHDILPPLSRRGAKVNAISSYVPRVVKSMYTFSDALVRDFDGINVATDEGTQYSPLLLCFSANPEYAEWREKGDWIPAYQDFVRKNVPTLPARRLISNPHLSTNRLRQISMEMYEVLKACQAAGMQPASSKWMSEKEFKGCWRASNLLHYFRNSVSSYSDIAARASWPLLKGIVDSADAAAAAPNHAIALQAYFGHAETLLPLLAAMKLPGAYAIPDDIDDLDKEWRVEDITPLGANLAIFFAKAPSGEIYAAVRLNGKPVAPVEGYGDIVKWSLLRNFWLNQK